MKCDKAMKKFLDMDNDASFTLSLKLHSIFCRECREEISALSETYSSLIGMSSFVTQKDMTDAIMAEVYKHENLYEHNVSYFKWISVGSIIIASRFLVSFSDTHIWLNSHFGINFEIPLNIVLGLVISIYLILFIASHIDDLKKAIHFPFKWM